MKKSARIHKFLSVVLSAVMLLAALPMASFAAAATLTYENLEYTVTNGEVTITRYAGTDEAVTVPAEIDGKPVTVIGDGAFSMTKITSLHLGKNVKPVSVQTGKPWNAIMKTMLPSFASAFTDTLLKPYASTESERNIAMNCMNLTKITVDSKNRYLRSYGGVLFSKDMTEMYCYPSGKQMHTYIIPLTVRDFYNAFGGLHLPPASVKIFTSTIDLMDDNNNGIIKTGTDWIDLGSNNPLKSVVIPAGVNSICYAAFYNTGLTSIFIPKNVEVIGKKAFWHCRALTTVGFDRNSTYKELPEQCFNISFFFLSNKTFSTRFSSISNTVI